MLSFFCLVQSDDNNWLSLYIRLSLKLLSFSKMFYPLREKRQTFAYQMAPQLTAISLSFISLFNHPSKAPFISFHSFFSDGNSVKLLEDSVIPPHALKGHQVFNSIKPPFMTIVSKKAKQFHT